MGLCGSGALPQALSLWKRVQERAASSRQLDPAGWDPPTHVGYCRQPSYTAPEAARRVNAPRVWGLILGGAHLCHPSE